jgi:hypothetical protein
VDWVIVFNPSANWSTRPPRDVQHHLADWSIRLALRDARHHATDWSTSPPILFPSGPRSPLPPPNPPKATQPTGLALSPPLPALPRRRAPVAPPCNPQAAWRGLSPRGEVLDHPPRGQAKCTTGPETPPCRRRAPALTLRACQRPAVPTAHPPPVRERRAPCPVRLAQSCLSTYSPTPSASRMVKVV